MAGCIKAASCACGVCRRCKARAQTQYRRNRDRGFTPQVKREVCQCGVCHHCKERVRVAAYYAKLREYKERGEEPPLTEREKRIKAKRERIEQLKRERAEYNRQAPLSNRQRSEVRSLVFEVVSQYWDHGSE